MVFADIPNTTGVSGRIVVDLTGYAWDEFEVIREVEPHVRANGHKVRQWECRCSCGGVRYLSTQEVRTHKRRSCGCKKKEYHRTSATEHGDSHTRLHNIWSGMRARCYIATDYHYPWYGGRGIQMCEEWINDYPAFKRWAVANGYRSDLSIDRINNDGPYSPDNCRWVDQTVQSNNTRRNHRVEIAGEVKTLADWSRVSGISPSTVRRRLLRGWSAEAAVYTPVQSRRGETDDLQK